MGWSDYGTGAGNCKSDASGTVWFQDLTTILVELTAAAKERMNLVEDTSTPFTAASGGSVAQLTIEDCEGMSRAQIKTNMTALRTKVQSLVTFSFYTGWKHFVAPDLTWGLTNLLTQGSYGSTWVAAEILSGDAWNQIRECFDNLTQMRWQGGGELGDWTEILFASTVEGWGGLHDWPEINEPDLSGATYICYGSKTGEFLVDFIWNSRPITYTADASGDPIKSTVNLTLDVNATHPERLSVDIGGTVVAVPDDSEITQDVNGTTTVIVEGVRGSSNPFEGASTGGVTVTGSVFYAFTDVSASLEYGV